MVVLNTDGTRDKFTMSSFVGVPRKHELMWIDEEPYIVVQVEYSVAHGFFGAKVIEAAGVYIRLLSENERTDMAKQLAPPAQGEDQRPFRP